ncbi:MAG TPA: glycosyltransferase family 2 protein [Candidatus Saccharimonadales bacterium]
MSKVSVVIPNWNGKDDLPACLDSLLAQHLQPHIIVVENGSKDGSLELLQTHYPQAEVIVHKKNKGFAGGVNAGIRKAMADGYTYVALFNNDAVADKDWLKNLVSDLDINSDAGIATCKLMSIDRKHLDSTGDQYTTWGLPYPRGRGEPVSDRYDGRVQIFAASGGASLYRMDMLREIGLFDEDFFAYYEDVDISFRAQLAGWKIRYVPEAIAYHKIGATSGKIQGFTTYQAMKNLPWLLYKNAPLSVFWRVLPRFLIAYYAFVIRSAWRGQSWPAVRGYCKMLVLLPKKTMQRLSIQHKRKVTAKYIWDAMTHELPPNARKLRLLFHPIKTLTNRT